MPWRKKTKNKPLKELLNDRNLTENSEDRKKSCRGTVRASTWIRKGLKRSRGSESRDVGNCEILEERIAEISVDSVLQTRSRLCDGKVDGPDDRLVSEMLKCKIFEVAHFSQERFMEKEQASDSWKIVQVRLPEEARCRAEEGDQGFQGQTAVMSKWYATCVVLCMEEEAEPKEFEELHVGGVDGICCQHLQVIMASILQRHRRLDVQLACSPCSSVGVTTYIGSGDFPSSALVLYTGSK